MPNEATSARGQPPNASLLPWLPARRRAVSHSPTEGPDSADAGRRLDEAQMKGTVGGVVGGSVGAGVVGGSVGAGVVGGSVGAGVVGGSNEVVVAATVVVVVSGIVVVSGTVVVVRVRDRRRVGDRSCVVVVSGTVVVRVDDRGRRLGDRGRRVGEWSASSSVVVGFGGLVVGGLVGPVDVPGAEVPGCGLLLLRPASGRASGCWSPAGEASG